MNIQRYVILQRRRKVLNIGREGGAGGGGKVQNIGGPSGGGGGADLSLAVNCQPSPPISAK